MSEVYFFSEDISFVLSEQPTISLWLEKIVTIEGSHIDNLNYIFCSDPYLLDINQQYLNHDFYTDVITFDNSDLQGTICGDIFISIDRVKENATLLSIAFESELNRVIIHGLLHLLGYSDKTDSDKEAMRQKEDSCLSLLTK